MACVNPRPVFNGFDVPMLVPCGHCRGCRLDRVKSWTFRLIAELPYHDDACFITFTYDDDHYFKLETDYSLQHRDIQLFMKRLRKRFSGKSVKYFCCGEYGGETYRCHYHMILFGYWPDDAVKDPFTDNYHSASLSSLWPNGDVCFGLVTPSSAAYVAGYINKKMGSTSSGIYTGVRPPYVACSKGIGLQYCLDNKEQLKRDMCVVNSEGDILPLPRYYKAKLGLSTEDLYENYLKMMDSKYAVKGCTDPERLHKRIKQKLIQRKFDLDVLEKRSNQRDNIPYNP